jgi:hypothetical protein
VAPVAAGFNGNCVRVCRKLRDMVAATARTRSIVVAEIPQALERPDHIGIEFGGLVAIRRLVARGLRVPGFEIPAEAVSLVTLHVDQIVKLARIFHQIIQFPRAVGGHQQLVARILYGDLRMGALKNDGITTALDALRGFPARARRTR